MRIDQCPNCGAEKNQEKGWFVIDSRTSDLGQQRRRRLYCKVCKFRTTTIELPLQDLEAMVEKRAQAKLKQSLRLMTDQIQALQTDMEAQSESPLPRPGP